MVGARKAATDGAEELAEVLLFECQIAIVIECGGLFFLAPWLPRRRPVDDDSNWARICVWITCESAVTL